jgi:hypothetical protein
MDPCHLTHVNEENCSDGEEEIMLGAIPKKDQEYMAVKY